MFDVEAYSYESKMDVTPSLISKGCVKKDNEKYYSKFEDVELLINGKRSLLVNNRLKKMTYNECNVMKKPDANEVQKALDSFSTTDSVVLGDSKNGDIHFIAYSKTGYIQRTDLYVDSKTLFVKHILYQYVPPNDEYDMDVDRIEIFYKNIQIKQPEISSFSFEKYFKSSKDRKVALGKYNGYKITSYKS